MKTKTILITLFTILLIATSRANLIPIGQVTFIGDFTLNHLYDFNNPGAQPFGTFANQTVASSNGIFSPFISIGDVLAGQQLWSEGPLPLFSLDGFSLLTFLVNISGPDSGRFVRGDVDLSGNGYQVDPSNTIFWSFIAPPYDISNFPEDITGPITLIFSAIHETGNVPDGGSTVALMGLGMLGLFFFARRHSGLLRTAEAPR